MWGEELFEEPWIDILIEQAAILEQSPSKDVLEIDIGLAEHWLLPVLFPAWSHRTHRLGWERPD